MENFDELNNTLNITYFDIISSRTGAAEPISIKLNAGINDIIKCDLNHHENTYVWETSKIKVRDIFLSTKLTLKIAYKDKEDEQVLDLTEIRKSLENNIKAVNLSLYSKDKKISYFLNYKLGNDPYVLPDDFFDRAYDYFNALFRVFNRVGSCDAEKRITLCSGILFLTL
jgi:hypothetical protein